ncbi:hypothetical protein K470DRAFT_223002 [Piedraia hortae CBS 480.64]|uniref:PH domain-containing protein n=1 Tax=Piedraia hortae CBS 480.64 TaxID=1314780 RepID=A0A6A7BQZ0_9PEZI|nr:hypothetical protein K470DRAFT_223002 [Piedraia hortae CBS 480.64]
MDDANLLKKRQAGSTRSIKNGSEENSFHSVLFTPIPTQGSPTEALANRFQAWRQLLKSLIAYFREVQQAYEARARAMQKLQAAAVLAPFLEGGLGDASGMLEAYHRRIAAESTKSSRIEADIVAALSDLRDDLGHKVKEIRKLGGDFKNSVERQQAHTRKAVEKLTEALKPNSHGKEDPYLLRLAVDRAVGRQIDEENYLHQAHINIESSGRELDSIIVGEIQKAYNALSGILKREADEAQTLVNDLRGGPISAPRDQEWTLFVNNEPSLADPRLPLRNSDELTYPGKDDPSVSELRSGMLERKSKFLKSYTPGWYILSPTHLHEFKSADKLGAPVMSLPLEEHKLGSTSEPLAASHKFMLKGRPSARRGGNSGPNWILRAESRDTMLAWYEDLKALTNSQAQRDAFVRKHALSLSLSDGQTVSSDGMEDDEADERPFLDARPDILPAVT